MKYKVFGYAYLNFFVEVEASNKTEAKEKALDVGLQSLNYNEGNETDEWNIADSPDCIVPESIEVVSCE
jgi:hypothetical protein